MRFRVWHFFLMFVSTLIAGTVSKQVAGTESNGFDECMKQYSTSSTENFVKNIEFDMSGKWSVNGSYPFLFLIPSLQVSQPDQSKNIFKVKQGDGKLLSFDAEIKSAKQSFFLHYNYNFAGVAAIGHMEGNGSCCGKASDLSQINWLCRDATAKKWLGEDPRLNWKRAF